MATTTLSAIRVSGEGARGGEQIKAKGVPGLLYSAGVVFGFGEL
jgi:hypothetical protein